MYSLSRIILCPTTPARPSLSRFVRAAAAGKVEVEVEDEGGGGGCEGEGEGRVAAARAPHQSPANGGTA